MKLLQRLPATSVILSALLLSTIVAADSSSLPSLPDPNKQTSSTQPPSSSTSPPTTSPPTTSPPKTSTTAKSEVTIPGTDGGTSSKSVPVITGGPTATGGGGLGTNAPKLPGQFEILPASVPPTANAPFMQSSSLPEGTVFIIVGAVLGFLGLLVLAWRSLIVWSLHRAVKRANMQQNMSDTKSLFRTPAVPMYKYADQGSSLSLANLTGKGGKKSRPVTTGTGGVNSSLFFSPTAGAAGPGMTNGGNRGSNYLPAGYYAAGASAPGNGAGLTHLGSTPGGGISLSNLGPHSRGYARAMSLGPSPPDSPSMRPNDSHLSLGQRGNLSSSTLDLNQRPTGRAPSAYLDGLFDDAGAAPTQLPNHGNSGRF